MKENADSITYTLIFINNISKSQFCRKFLYNILQIRSIFIRQSTMPAHIVLTNTPFKTYGIVIKQRFFSGSIYDNVSGNVFRNRKSAKFSNPAFKFLLHKKELSRVNLKVIRETATRSNTSAFLKKPRGPLLVILTANSTLLNSI